MPLSDLVLSLLTKRGITTESDIAAFLRPDYEAHTHSAMLFPDMAAAVERTLAAIERGERIAVYADFDCDGIPGAALLSDLFNKIGYSDISLYIPHRDREGHGFHAEAVASLARDGVKLIITVDVGTTALESVRAAKALGVDVIITDHHEITGELPEAIAILNPKLGYPFPHLCGTGVAYKFAQALLHEGRTRGLARFASVAEGWEKWLLDLVAIATVADMVPLIGENRVLASWGLQVLRKSPRAGITALCSALRLRKNELTENDIGFSIAPRINAASRMDEPQLALEMLTTRDRVRADELAKKLEKLNASRKAVVASIVKEAAKVARTRFGADEQVVALGNPEWKPALLGLAANSLVGKRGGMVCMWGRDALGRLKGSCRSDGSVNVVELFAAARDSFVEYGGHAASGGFTLVPEKVHTLHEDLAQAAKGLSKGNAEKAPHDALITLREVSSTLFEDISRLAPFGVGNPKPLFLVRNARVVEFKAFGKEKNHLEISLSCIETGVAARSFDFFRSPDDFTRAPRAGESAGVLATLERDTYRGGFALRLVDIVEAT